MVTDAPVQDLGATALQDVGWTCKAEDVGAHCLVEAGTGPLDTTVTLAPGSAVTFTLHGTVAADATGTLDNTATVAPPPGVTDPDLLNNISPDTNPLTPQADLEVTKSNGGSSVVPGSQTTYLIEVRNAGPSAVKGVTVSDPLPPGLSAFTWSCIFATAGSVCPEGEHTGALSDVPVDLAAGGTVRFVVRAQVSPTAGGSVTNTVTVQVPKEVDPDLGNNTASDTDTVAPKADIAVAKTVDNAMPQVGEMVTFTVTATNNGPEAASGVQLSDDVPAGLALIRATPSPGTIYTPAMGVWDIGPLAVGAQAKLTLEVRVEQAGLIRNVATKILGDQFDPNTSNDSSGVDLTNQPGPVPGPGADIQVHKTADTVVLPVGNDVTFTVTVTNAGPSAASGRRTHRPPPGGAGAGQGDAGAGHLHSGPRGCGPLGRWQTRRRRR